jgi:hypothetical protein
MFIPAPTKQEKISLLDGLIFYFAHSEVIKRVGTVATLLFLYSWMLMGMMSLELLLSNNL